MTSLTADSPDIAALRNVKILVVDDDDDTRDLIAAVLKNAGAAVTTANSVREAIAVMSKQDAELLVSDIGMPFEDGYELIRRVRQGAVSDAARSMPAVAVTAFASAKDRQAALSAGFQAHVSKPFDAQGLVQLLSRLAQTHA